MSVSPLILPPRLNPRATGGALLRSEEDVEPPFPDPFTLTSSSMFLLSVPQPWKDTSTAPSMGARPAPNSEPVVALILNLPDAGTLRGKFLLFIYCSGSDILF